MTLDPELPQVACFDTAFHRTAPEKEQAFALPYALYEEGVRRYGFHGPAHPEGLDWAKDCRRPQTEGHWRSHQVPFGDMEKPEHVKLLEEWMRSYRPQELFDGEGRLRPEIAALAPAGERRMGANPHANGGLLRRELAMPDFADYAVEVTHPGRVDAEATRVMGGFLRDIMRDIMKENRHFRLFGPDETASNRLSAVFEATDRAWVAETLPEDDHLAPDGRVMEILSEHTCEGWLEGYLLTERHGLFSCYEAFIHIVDSMFNQHAKWLKTSREIPGRDRSRRSIIC